LSIFSLSDEAHAIAEWTGDNVNANNKAQMLMNPNFKQLIILDSHVPYI
jgi:hypothetical protein